LRSITQQTRRRRIRPIASGFRESATERGIGGDQKLNLEGLVGGNEASNINEGFDSECPAISHQEKINRGMARQIEGA
jgi:hypothetical protein